MGTQVINSIGFEALLQARNAITERIAQAHALMMQAQEIATRNSLGRVGFRDEWCPMAMKDFVAPGGDVQAIALTDREAWRRLLEQSNVMDIMSARRKQEWRTALDKGEAPPFTQEAIVGTFKDLYGSCETTFETSVVECFEQLHTSYWANKPTSFNKRIILSNVTDVYAGGVPGRSACDQVDDLLRFMHLIEKRPIPHAHRVRDAILSALTAKTARFYEDEYIHLRWFKNGNGHLTFKRQDLVEALNHLIAKHRANTLPQPRNARFNCHA